MMVDDGLNFWYLTALLDREAMSFETTYNVRE